MARFPLRRSAPFGLLCSVAVVLSCGFACCARAQSKSAAADASPSPAQLNGTPCLAIEDAAKRPGKDVCVAAHVFDVVELSDGTRYLDVCAPDVPDDRCQFTFVSFRSDREEVGDLSHYRNQNVRVRGIIRSTHGRMGVVLSHMRQFRGGPEKFRPNPRLVRGFDAQADRPPVRDPNLAGSGRHRSFMNPRDTESLAGRSPR